MTWLRTTLTSYGTGRGLFLVSPRVTLVCLHDGYALTSPYEAPSRGRTLGTVLDWCADHGIPKPTTPDLAWVEYR